MQKALSLLIALALGLGFSGMALAGGDFAGCSHFHTAQYADKADTAKTETTAKTEKADADKLVLAQQDQTAPSTSDMKK